MCLETVLSSPLALSRRGWPSTWLTWSRKCSIEDQFRVPLLPGAVYFHYHWPSKYCLVVSAPMLSVLQSIRIPGPAVVCPAILHDFILQPFDVEQGWGDVVFQFPHAAAATSIDKHPIWGPLRMAFAGKWKALGMLLDATDIITWRVTSIEL